MGVGADGVADVQVLDLGDGDDVAGDGFRDRLAGFALDQQQAAATAAAAGAMVDDLLFGGDLSGQDAEVA